MRDIKVLVTHPSLSGVPITMLGVATIELQENGATFYKFDARETNPAPGPTPAPQPNPTERLSLLYFGPGPEDLEAAVLRVRPDYQVVCDTTVIPGSGLAQPPIHYGSQDPATHPLPNIECVNPEHPYFVVNGLAASSEHVKALGATFAHAAKPDGLGGTTLDPLKVWETGQTNTDPDSMIGALMIGGNAGGAMERYKGFIFQYIRRYGRQAPRPPAPVWRSGSRYSDALIAQINALPQAVVDALERGEDPGVAVPELP